MSDMNLGISDRVRPLLEAVRTMVRDEIMPLSDEFEAEVGKGDRWTYTPRQTEILEGLKQTARDRGLWNFWLTDSDRGYGLTTVEYAYLAEEMGKTSLGAETFNCSAPDTGNMEVLERYGSDAHKEQWLAPLLDGKIRSAYLMTEPDVASSDATNVSMSCVRDGDFLRAERREMVVFGKPETRAAPFTSQWSRTGDHDAPKHQRHSMILVPADTPGIEKLRAMQVYGHDDAHAWPFAPAVHRRPGSGRKPHPRRGPGLRDRPGPVGAGPHPPLHARHRTGRICPRADVQAVVASGGLRQAVGPAGAPITTSSPSAAWISRWRGCCA